MVRVNGTDPRPFPEAQPRTRSLRISSRQARVRRPSRRDPAGGRHRDDPVSGRILLHVVGITHRP